MGYVWSKYRNLGDRMEKTRIRNKPDQETEAKNAGAQVRE
jgi:hypothetical protein